MKHFLSFLLSLSLLACSSGSTPNLPSQHAKAAYSERDLSDEIKAQIGDFPKPGSEAQKADEMELRKLQKSRTAEDCKRANSEVVVTLQNFYGKPYGDLNEQQLAVLNPLVDQIRSEFGNYIGYAKRAYARPRPYEYVMGLVPCLPKEPSLAYPSGHAILAVFYGDILADFFPEQAERLQQRAEQISKDRVLGGVHHPSDVEAGKKLGHLLYSELKKSKRYQADVDKYKMLLK